MMITYCKTCGLNTAYDCECAHDPSGRECALAGRGDPAGCKTCLADIAKARIGKAFGDYRGEDDASVQHEAVTL